MKPPIFRRMFGYNLSLLPNAHLATFEAGVSTIEEARPKTGATIGFPGWGMIYHLLLSHLDRNREETLIETGTNHGCTSIVMAQALVDSGCSGRLLTFELEQQNVDTARRNLAAANVLDRVILHQGDTKETLKPALSALEGIRFAFLDASHLFDDVMVEFETVLPHLAPDALVLFDNTYAIAEPPKDPPRVNDALKAIKHRYGGNLINLEHVSWYTPGLAMWQCQPAL